MKLILPILLLITFFAKAQVQIGGDIDGDSANDNAGTVAISADGSVLAIGAVGHNSFRGQVRVFEFSSGPFGSSWVQEGNDILGEAEGDFFGREVALSSDGNIIAIGASANDGNGSNSGHVRVYENISGTWTQIGNDIDGEAIDDFSGDPVSLSADGNIVAIGSTGNDGNGSNSGHVRVYENLSGTWTQIGSDIDGEAEGDNSGGAVSLSSDGSIVAIGADRNDGNGSNSGHVRVYEYIVGVWTQIGSDINGEAEEDFSGGRFSSVSLSSDGNIVAIGASLNDGNGSNSGHVRVYENISSVWTQIGSDINGEAEDDRSGVSISLSSDGSLVAVGAIRNDGNGSNSGHVRVYKNISSVWTQIGTDIDGEAEDDSFGQSVALSSDASTLAIGNISDNNSNGIRSGRVSVYDLNGLLSSNDYTLSEFNLYPNPVKNILHLDTNTITIKNALLYSIEGKLISQFTISNNTINLKNLTSGLYFLKLVSDKGSITKKIIKQ